ncbi:alpha/beta-hydrolase [Daldinia sp. FL1419]|nr:alpha/beta-hydrolase [Daldinia sp. FL1419]
MYLYQKAISFLVASRLLATTQATSFNGSYDLGWKPCPTWLPSWHSSLRCGSLSVPLDWDHLEKGNITIGVAKLPARKQKNRKGNIFYQPGGPGNAGSHSIAQMATGDLEVGAELLDRFDMIGVDLRGTGLSEPIKCDAQLINARLPWYPSDPNSFKKRVQHNLATRKSCLEMSGNNLIDYMDSISIAKDYEAVRIALGGEKMNWLGVSYGTQLGSQYAELFPNNIRSMVFDGIVSLSQSQISLFLSGAAGLDATFRRFAQWCQAQNATVCPAVRDAKKRSILEMWTDILAQADKKPIPCTSSLCLYPDMTADEIRLGASNYFYAQYPNWGYLGQAIYNTTTQNDSSPFAQLYPQVTNDTSAASVYSNSAMLAGLAIVCQDWAHHDTAAEDIKLKQVLARSQAPLMNGMSTAHRFQLPCIGWSGNVRNPAHRISIPRPSRLPRVLLVDTIYDSATPLPWGMQLREEIGKDRTVLVLRNAGGHPTYEQRNASGGDTKSAIETYIFNLTLPEDGVIFST